MAVSAEHEMRVGLCGRKSIWPDRFISYTSILIFRFGLRTIDIWSKMQSFPRWQTSFLRDGLHLTPRGNRLLFEEVVWALRDANQSLETLPADLPLCSDIDPNNAVKHFEHVDAIPQD